MHSVDCVIDYNVSFGKSAELSHLHNYKGSVLSSLSVYNLTNNTEQREDHFQ